MWDEDVGSKDDLIGRLRVPLGRLLAEDGYAAPAEWKTLVDDKGATSGMVKLRVNWHRLLFLCLFGNPLDPHIWVEVDTARV